MDDSDVSDSASSNPAAPRPSSPSAPQHRLSPNGLPSRYQAAVEDLSDYDGGLFDAYAVSPLPLAPVYIGSEDDDEGVSIVSHNSSSSSSLLFDIAEDDDDDDDEIDEEDDDDDEEGEEEEDDDEYQDNHGDHRHGDRNAPLLANLHRQHWPRRWQQIHQVGQILQGIERQVAMDENPFLPGQDELIHVAVERSHEAARNIRREIRRRRADPPARPQEGQAIIDLTGEPDSPVQVHRSIPAQQQPPADPQQPRNPRRQMSQSGRTPSLTRSDGSILGSNSPAPQVPIIDLTGDSPEERIQHGLPRQGSAAAQAPPHNNRRQAQAGGSNGGGGRGGSRPRDHQDSPEVAFMGIFARLNELNGGLNSLLQLLPRRPHRIHHLADDVEIIGQNPVPRPGNIALANPLLGNPVQFNYQANGFGANRGEPPKPPHVPPPAAREGFTRNTGEDVVAVCASCEEELKYDPEAADDGPPAKRARTKKDREEHHFWAVPECGHVYCRLCFDNRRVVLKKENKDDSVRFEASGKSIRCAVNGCNSDVTNKRNWVGIFL